MNIMLIVEITEKRPIEKVLKILKRKWDKTKTLKELRDRKYFKKKSDKRREQIKKAAYVQKKYNNID